MKHLSTIQVIAVFASVLLIAPALPSTASDNTVSVIYFIPKDRQFQWELPAAVGTQMKKVQTFYADQMEDHGYGRKTFNLEKDGNDQVIVHIVIAQHNDSHYHTDTLNKIANETNARFNNEEHIYVFVADISTERVQGNCGIARFDGGPVIVPASGNCVAGDNGVELIAHELGHALNLEHDFRDNTYIMSYGSERTRLSMCAAHLLNVSPFFNPASDAENTDATINLLTPTRYAQNADLTLQFEVNDPDGIHQVQFLLSVPNEATSIMGCKQIDALPQAIVDFKMPDGATVSPTNIAYIRIVDANGNITGKTWTLTATPDTNVVNVVSEEKITYITLTYDSDDALVPINPRNEWSGWREKLVWEKTPDGLLPRRPNQFMNPDDTLQFYDQWDHFFYSHAASRLVFDVSGANYESFQAKFDMPNPCNNLASVKIVCLADTTEIYNSGVLRGNATRNIPISFDIPENTQTLTITVTDADDGNGCDHFIFGNPRLLYAVTEPPEPPNNYTDINGDGVVNIVDLILVAVRYGETITGDTTNNPDVNRDGIVDIQDIILVTQDMPPIEPASAPRNTGATTVLLPNYPNPFNPETWIPYQLAKPSDIKITIYNASGHVARQLHIGYQQAGRYITQSRAAYWDGKNENGERVASGVYFYELQTETTALVKKMLVLK